VRGHRGHATMSPVVAPAPHRPCPPPHPIASYPSRRRRRGARCAPASWRRRGSWRALGRGRSAPGIPAVRVERTGRRDEDPGGQPHARRQRLPATRRRGRLLQQGGTFLAPQARCAAVPRRARGGAHGRSRRRGRGRALFLQRHRRRRSRRRRQRLRVLGLHQQVQPRAAHEPVRQASPAARGQRLLCLRLRLRARSDRRWRGLHDRPRRRRGGGGGGVRLPVQLSGRVRAALQIVPVHRARPRCSTRCTREAVLVRDRDRGASVRGDQRLSGRHPPHRREHHRGGQDHGTRGVRQGQRAAPLLRRRSSDRPGPRHQPPQRRPHRAAGHRARHRGQRGALCRPRVARTARDRRADGGLDRAAGGADRRAPGVYLRGLRHELRRELPLPAVTGPRPLRRSARRRQRHHDRRRTPAAPPHDRRPALPPAALAVLLGPRLRLRRRPAGDGRGGGRADPAGPGAA